MTEQTTFSKFDTLGAVLTELSFQSVSLHFTRGNEGARDHSTVYLHNENGDCSQGIGNTPSEALADALQGMARKEAARVEVAAQRVAA